VIANTLARTMPTTTISRACSSSGLRRGLINQIPCARSRRVADRWFAFWLFPIAWVLAWVAIRPVITTPRASPHNDRY
jgi:hypothetical protein